MNKGSKDRVILSAQDSHASREFAVMRYVLEFGVALGILVGVVIFLATGH